MKLAATLQLIHDGLASAHDLQIVLADGPRDQERMDGGVMHAEQFLLPPCADAPQHARTNGDEPALGVFGKKIGVRQKLEQSAELLRQSHALEEGRLERARGGFGVNGLRS